MAGRDHDAASRFTLAHQQGNRGRRTGRVGEPHGHARYGNGLGGSLGEAFRCEAIIESDDHSAIGLLGSDDVTSDGVSDFADIFKREVVGNNATPAVGAKADRTHGANSICEAMALAKRSELEQFLQTMAFQPLHHAAYVLCAFARADQKRVGRFHDDQVRDSHGGDEF